MGTEEICEVSCGEEEELELCERQILWLERVKLRKLILKYGKDT